MSFSGPDELSELIEPQADSEVGANLDVEIDLEHSQVSTSEGEPVSEERDVLTEDPKPLPLHIQRSLELLLGEEVDDYINADEEDKAEIILKKIGGLIDESTRGSDQVIDQSMVKASLDMITTRSQHELSDGLKILSVERATDLLDRINAVSTTARRLGANKIRGFLGLGLGVLAGGATSLAIRFGERAAGWTGGVTGATLGAVSYQALYQRAVERSWQRVSNPIGAYIGAVLSSPFKVANQSLQDAEMAHNVEPKSFLGRLWQSAKIGYAAYRFSLGDRLREIHNQSRLQHATIDSLEGDELLWRVAAARLALTRQERRVSSTDSVNDDHRNQLSLYSHLVERAVTEFTPSEIKLAMDAVRNNARLHLAGSVVFGVVGGLLGYFGARALAHDGNVASSEPTTDLRSSSPLPSAPNPNLPAPAPSLAPTPVHQLSDNDLAQLGHLGRAKALESVGAGHFENGRFVITAEQGVDAQGQYIMAAGRRLSVNNGVTDITPVRVEMREYAEFRSAEIQRAVTGDNLVKAYRADQSTLAQATQIKDALAKHLVEQQIYGKSNLDANIQQQLTAVGYDFDYSDVRSTNDVRAEIHQAMSKWFSAQPKPAPVTDWKPALPRLIEVARPSFVPVESIHTAGSPSIERYIYEAPVATVSEPLAAIPELASAPRLDLSSDDQPQLQEYQGWHWPVVEVEKTAQAVEPTIKVDVIQVPKVSPTPVAPAEPVLARPDLGSTPTVAVGPGAPQHPSFEARVDKKAVLDDFFPDGGPQISPAEIEEAIQDSQSALTD